MSTIQYIAKYTSKVKNNLLWLIKSFLHIITDRLQFKQHADTCIQVGYIFEYKILNT